MRSLGVIASTLALLLGACDAMIADRIVIETSGEYPGAAETRPQLLQAMLAATSACHLANPKTEATGNEALSWRDPEHPPGLHILIDENPKALLVTLAQDLYGSVGPTEAYRCMRTALPRELAARLGSERVRARS
jgi:hypothetical protein